ncbi:MAG: SLBB domain-containing protein [Syntrophales bacterium]|nr:SLBB domain-containing protein [Syntrophales bacterium]
MIKKAILCMVVLLLIPAFAGSQTTGAAVGSLPGSAPALTAEQSTAVQNLNAGQKAAIAQELGKSGGQITPEAVEALKGRPEFQGLSPEEVAKGKELLKANEGKDLLKVGEGEKAKKASEPKDKTAAEQKQVISEAVKGETLFERAQNTGKYQDISLKLRPFGYDFFQEAAVNVITQRKDIPVPLKYVVGPDDEVKVTLWGRVNASYKLVVNRDGKIDIPGIGPLAVAGMTFEEMSSSLIKQAEQMTGTNVDISMGSLRTIPVFVLGDVRRPGAYTIGAFATITDALLISGGPSEIGSMRNIQLKRKDKVVRSYDLYDLLLKGDKSHDVTLQAGDIVFVPVIGPYAGIAGNVKRPALYEFKDNYSLDYLLELAGGIVPSAYTQQIQVERTVKNEKQIVIDIDDKRLDRAKSFILQDADIVKVFSIVDKDVNVVYLSGNVKRGGKYALRAGMRLGDILKSEQDVLPDTYFDYALIKRLRPPTMESVLVPFNLGDLILRGDPKSNLELQPADSIYVFSRWFFKDKPYFTVSGEVRTAGRFELSDNSRVKDALLTAGELTKNAYLRKGEIVRVDKNKEFFTLYFDVARAMAGDPAENILLQDEDHVIVHSLYEEKWKEQVAVAGEVKKPGEFLLTEKMQVSDLLFKAGGQTRDTLLTEAELYRTDWKTKKQTLLKISLAGALSGNPTDNLELRDLDRLVVHSIWETTYKKNVSVEGDVLKPGTYPLAERMTVRNLVFAAGNILESASLQEAELSSRTVDKDNRTAVVHRQINLGKALAGDPQHNLPLKPHDRLFIKSIPDWQVEKYAVLSGKIKYPGRYVIAKGEKLSAVIERAGGYSDDAYLRGAFFTRESVRAMQQKGLTEMADRMERELLTGSGIVTAASAEEMAAKKAELEQKKQFVGYLRGLKATGRMTIRLAHLRLLKGSEYDIELEDGDTLFIPPSNNVVNVTGSVMSQGSFIYSSRMDYKDYISLTGGYAKYADTDNIFVLKVDGSARKLSRGFFNWSSSRDRWEVAGFEQEVRTIEPGDTIIVPEKVERIAWLREVKDITQILMNSAVTAGVFKALF